MTINKKGYVGIVINGEHITENPKSLEDIGNLMNTDRCIQVYNNAMKELVARYIQFHDSSKTIDCYIED